MKKNGFTLAELLGVIVILAAVALIAFPPIINQIKKSRGDLDEALNSLILTAAEQYLDERNSVKEGKYCIVLNVLVEDGKLVEPITDSNGNVVSLSSLFYIKYPTDTDDSYEYKLVNNDDGNLCEGAIAIQR